MRISSLFLGLSVLGLSLLSFVGQSVAVPVVDDEPTIEEYNFAVYARRAISEHFAVNFSMASAFKMVPAGEAYCSGLRAGQTNQKMLEAFSVALLATNPTELQVEIQNQLFAVTTVGAVNYLCPELKNLSGM
jgi:hypothetical protein